MDSYIPFMTSDLYVLKHKDIDVAMVRVNKITGQIEFIIDVYHSEELPVGCKENSANLAEWWNNRAIPDSRRGIQKVLNYVNQKTSQALMLSSYGLSLTDHYWMQPVEQELYWSDINFFENDFSDDLGELLTDTGTIDIDKNITQFSPSSSVNGEMKKKWLIKDGKRYLMKVNINNYGQQAVNELIASRLHKRLGWSNYVPYFLEKITFEGKEYPCSLNEMFTSPELELVSGYQLIKDFKVPQDMSEYECMIKLAAAQGLDKTVVRKQLEYTIMTDFILTNTDRHYNNFGFLYDSTKKKLVHMAPIFDTGNALFYQEDYIPTGKYLLDIRVASFLKREVDLLQYVRHPELISIDKLNDFSKETGELLREYTKMPESRIHAITRSIDEKIDFLDAFLHGKKIWKPQKYW